MQWKPWASIAGIIGIAIALRLAGCSSGSDPFVPTPNDPGTIQIKVEPAGFAAPWTLDGPGDADVSGTGARTFADAAVGSYTIAWGSVSDWECTSGTVETLALASGATIVFTGSYEPLSAGLVIYEPSAQTIWRHGQIDVPIRWVGGTAQDLESIALFADGSFATTIATQVPNGGELLTWDVPAGLEINDGYQLRITQGGVDSWSAEFRIGPAVEILFPNASTIWGLDTEVLIVWEAAQSDGTVKLDLYQGDSPASAISAAAPNTGSFSWHVPSSLAPGTDYQVHATIGSFEAESELFTIAAEGAIVVSLPDAATTWQQGQQNVAIAWSGGDTGEPVDLLLFRSGTQVENIATATGNDGSHDAWDVPMDLAVGTGYRVRINQGALSAESEEFTVEPAVAALEVTQPTSGTVWQQGQANVLIAWTGGDPVEPVSLYLYDGDSPAAPIAIGTPNDGSHSTWDVPGNLPPGSNYRVRVVQGANEAFSEAFTVAGVALPLAVVAPDSSTIWTQGQENVLITWTGGDAAQTVEIALYKGASEETMISAATANDGSFETWDVPAGQAIDDDYRVRVAQAGGSAYSKFFRISDSVPLEVTQPSASTDWYQGQEGVAITWNGGDPGQPVSLFLYKGTDQIAPPIAADTPNDGNHAGWDVPLSQAIGTDYRVQVVQGAADDFSEYFEITPRPIVVTQPASGTEWYPGQANVTISWTGGIPAQSVRIRLYRGGSLEATPGASEPNDGIMTWNVPSNLTIASNYLVRIDQGANIGDSESFSIVAPPLVVTQPTSGTVWQPGQANVTITWTGGDPAQSVELALAAGASDVAPIATTNNDGSHTSWDVPADLPYGTSYRVRISQSGHTAYSQYFQIGWEHLQVTEPMAATVWESYSTVSIEWSGGNPAANVALYLYKGAVQYSITSATANNGQYSWGLGSWPSADDYRVQVAQAADYDYSEYFQIEAPPPPLHVIEPDTLTVWTPGQQNVTITWSGGDPDEPVDLNLVTAEWADSLVIASSTPNDGSHTSWDVPVDVPNGYYRVLARQDGDHDYSHDFFIGIITAPRIVIDPNPNGLNAPWTLTGPNGFSQGGIGDNTLGGMQPGSYTISWGTVAGWTAPVDATQFLAADGTITFSGTYVENTGSIVIDPNPNSLNAPWTLTGPNAFSQIGYGDLTLSSMPGGSFSVLWGTVAGWTAPADATQFLAADGTITFSGTYTENTLGSIAIDPNPNGLDAPWTLTGPGSYNHAASGDVLLQELDPGSYTILWGSVAGWIRPGTETKTLAAGGSITFSGTYTELAPIDPGFVLIDDGEFLMGAPANELGTAGDERPQHTLTLTRSFHLQSTEVTNQQYLELAQWAYEHGHVTATTASLRDNLDGSTHDLLDLFNSNCEIAFSDGTFRLRDAGHGINPEHPVEEVTWYGAAAYCDWLSLKAGLPRAYNHSTWQCNGNSPYTAAGYRLPTEAEWEYACRAGSTTAFANGPITRTSCSPVDPVLNEIGWYCGNAGGWTHPVGQKIPNAWGLYDMHGNLAEWCNDWYSSTYYGSSPSSDPVGPVGGLYRLFRGGNWNLGAQSCRSASRSENIPGDSWDTVGFRPARSAD